MKDLGIVIDLNLSFEAHMQEKIIKAYQTMGMIRRTFISMDESMFVCLFKTFIRPQIHLSPYKLKDVNAIENVQRRATKLIPSLKELTMNSASKNSNFQHLSTDVHGEI